MEKHKCKLCFKSFTNGRALGGHMKSHMLNLPVPPKVTERERLPTIQLSRESDSASYSLSSSDEEKGQLYGLRENPKRSVRMVDPEFVDAGSVVLQDRESETESSKNPTCKRSKQTRRIQENHHQQQQQHERKKLKVNQVSETESWAEPEPVSSISDTTTDEDVAFCLMMLSRDQWKTKVVLHDNQVDDDDDDDEESMEEYYKLSKVNYRTIRGKYKCETCNKVFKSYQALGGHRASHKKRPSAATHETENVGTTTPTATTTSSISMRVKKIHECPVCFRVFSSGQALGGHKRSHVITGQVAATTTAIVKSSKKLGDSFIDLNLPAPIDDDDANVSQIELSAVSDAEFVNHFKR